MKIALSLTLAAALALCACGKSEPAAQSTPAPATRPVAPLVEVTQVDWCKEHFMPESICVQCHPDLADGFKKKNDWCAEHNLPDSQCFKHHPELKAQFAAAYNFSFSNTAPT